MRRGNCKGHTLVELLIAMTLSMLMMAALVRVSMLSLKSLTHIQNTQRQINQLNQSISQLESDIKSTALTACTVDKSNIINTLASQPDSSSEASTVQWLYGYFNNSWYPQPPVLSQAKQYHGIDAIQILKTDMAQPISGNAVRQHRDRIVYITNCQFSEISRISDSVLIKKNPAPSELFIYAFQIIHYHLRAVHGKQTLYRQYLGKSGTPVSEPLVDNVHQLKIGFAEKLDNDSIVFYRADKVINWSNIVAVFISITLVDAIHNPLPLLITLDNLQPDIMY